MFESMLLLAARGDNSPVDEWLNKNPLVLGNIAIAIGLLLALSGISALQTGTTTGKRGVELTGGIARFTGFVLLLIGIGLCGFGVYKMING